MPYTTPTATQFKDRYPEFASLTDARIDAVMADALLWVDQTWRIEADYQPAIMAYTAHILKVEATAAASGASGGAVSGPIKSESLGDASITYADNTSSDWRFADADLATTPYGTSYLRLRNRNHPAILTT